ncbi:PF04536 family protein [Leptospira broomii serovar Hurstbridge str. 5399]|uniref:PF04536 family protein n=1 Tax=Leptospira broomii serovar Hurstbridge str. 5399 TaxID=1049789 RepID=T0F063_9LEPT|nr:YgcG family protein [Leptospira broomii]EQA44535.1 PF04536 family protein [Leptospira broomii serovar Hurstbridge str. 5399]
MKRFGVFFLLLMISIPIFSEPISIPSLTRRVTDLTGTLNSEEVSSLENKLEKLEERKGSQIAILILPSTGEETIEQYSIRVADAWKIGRKSVADGIIFIVAKDDRKMRFEVGRGLEGAVPDATCKRIQIEYVRPLFKEGKYFEGIDAGIDKVIGLIDGEPLPEPDTHTSFHGSEIGSSDMTMYFIVLGIIALLVGFAFRRLFSPIQAVAATAIAYWAGGVFGISLSALLPILVVFFIILWVLYSAIKSGGGGGGSSWSSWGGGGSSWGSSSGGSSWGGGGGDFGGGGSSSDW